MATHNQEDIVRYVDDEMSPAERSQMEADLAEDAALAADVQLYVELRAELAERLPADLGAEALQGTLTHLNSQYFKTSGGAKIVSFRKYFVGVAAAASIIIVAVMLWPSTKGNYMDQFGGTQMVGSTERGEGNDSLMRAASASFNANEYAKAVGLLDRVIAADSANQEAIFYRGVAKLRTGAVEGARGDLLKVYNGTSLFKYEAAFFMGLSYAETDKLTALGWLGKIPEGAPGFEKAAALKKKLD